VYPESIKKVIDIFLGFPTVGSRTATRFAFHLAKQNKKETKELLEAIIEIKNKIKTCSFCFNVFESENNDSLFCEICSDKTRNKKTVCVVEKETDIEPIEQTKKYKGLYFVLGGSLSPLRKESFKKIRIKELIERIKENDFQEIIVATNFTPQGESTALYLERTIKPLKVKTTRLAKGLPTGSELEYIDQETLSSSLEGRK
jgi:recombination protein RecR